MTHNGCKYKNEYFERLGKRLDLNEKQIQGVFKRMTKYKPLAIGWIDKSFLSDDMKVAYKNVLEKRYEQLKLTNK